MKRSLKYLLVLGLLTIFLYSGVQVYGIMGAYMRAEKQYADLTQHVVLREEKPAEPLAEVASSLPQPEKEELPAWPQVDFAALAAINPDIVGWLTIEGTSIHYPVVQGEDNAFYLTHQFDKSQNRAGCLFLDAENDADFTGQNQIIYGHYTKDKSMFYELRGYKTQDFYDAHPSGWLITPSAVYRLRFFSGYVSDVYGNAWDRAFSKEDYLKWLNGCKKKSYFSSEVTPDADSRVLTLSTCSYEFENARFVLHAVLDNPIEN